MEVPASTKFTWKIDNFSELTKRKLHSDIFIAGRCKWRVLIFPKGNNVFDNLSIYLAIADPMNLPHGWSRDADFSLSVINQFNNRLTVIKDVKHVFNEKTSFWGFASFIPLCKTCNPAAGYLVNDTLTVEAEVQAHSVVHYSAIEPAISKEASQLLKRASEIPLDQDPMSCHIEKYQRCVIKEENLPNEEVYEANTMAEPSSRASRSVIIPRKVEMITVPPPPKISTALVTRLTAKPLSQTEAAVQTGAPTNDPEIVKEPLPPPAIVDEKDLPQVPPSEPVLSSPDVRKISKKLLTEISSWRRIQKSFPSSESPVSGEATRPGFVSQQKEALLRFFNMSLEAIQQANAFDNIEGIILAIVQHADSLKEKTILEDLATHLAEFRESIPNSTTIAETVEARRISLAGKNIDLNARLDERQKEIIALEDKFSTLSEEEANIQAEIHQLLKKKQERLSLKKSVAIELQKANEGALRDLEELRGLEGKIKQSNAEWLGAKEKAALANVRWKLFKEDLGFGKFNIV